MKGLNPLFSLANSENDFLVRQVVWNHFEASLRGMCEKFERLDLVIIAGEVAYLPHEGVRNV